MRKGIILAGGSGTRLAPLTEIVCKQLLPVYDKPMIYYPLSLLMIAGIRDVLLITDERNMATMHRLFGKGERFGINLEYALQPQPNGLAEAFILGEEFLAGEDVCMVLGDNLLFGHGLSDILRRSNERRDATVFGYQVPNPEQFGVVELDGAGTPISIVEKPAQTKSNLAVPGIYFFDGEASRIAKCAKPSARGELEITSVIEEYLRQRRLKVEILGRGFAWIDCGSHGSLLDASNFVQTIERRQSLKIGCPEEIAYASGWIDRGALLAHAKRYGKSSYGEYLAMIAQ